MAEKTSELKRNDPNDMEIQDPVAITAGAATEPGGNRYSDEYAPSESERRELAANTGEPPEETEHLKAQIEETRHQMGKTIDRIQERLSFSNLSEQVSEHVTNAIETAKDTVYDATIGKAVGFMKNMGDGISDSTVMKTARDNPFPLALIGLGAGLLAYNMYKPRQHRSFDGRREWSAEGTYPEPVRGKGFYESAQDRVGGMTDTVTDAAGQAYDSTRNAVNSAYEGVSNAVGTAYSSAGDVAHKAYDRAGEFGHYAQDRYEHYIDENPLAVGAVALAVGAAIGFAIPSTRYEGELMGDARQDLMNRAQQTAAGFVDKAKQVASEAGNTISDEVNQLAG